MLLRNERDLAQFVLRRRKELRLTQQELATRAGVRRATVADLERRSTRATFATAVALLAALDVALETTVAGAPTSSARRRPVVDLDDHLARVRDQ